MRSLTVIIGFLAASVMLSHGEPVFYAIASGKNYERIAWHSSPTKADFEKVLTTAAVFDFYTVKREGGKVRRVHRTFSTPSGDWVFYLDYAYREDGVLTKIVSDFRTFSGFDAKADDFLPTRCEREFARNEEGKFIILTEKITDVNSGKTVKRSFHTPEIKHWTNVSKLPNPTKLETKSATDR